MKRPTAGSYDWIAVGAPRTWWTCGGDLLALDDNLDQEPINYLVEQQEQDQSEVVVLSLAGQTKLSSLELVLGAASSGISAPAKFPAGPPPDHNLSAAAEYRMNLTVGI